MVSVDDIYNKYKDEIKLIVAREKLLTGEEISRGRAIAYKISDMIGKDGKELYLDNDNSNMHMMHKDLVRGLRERGVSFLVTLRLISAIHIDSTLERVKFEDYILRKRLFVVGSDSVKHLELKNCNNNIKLSDFSNVETCCIGGTVCSNNSIRIVASDYELVNCFNNQSYDYVYIKRNKRFGSRSSSMINCFNNCKIGKLVIDDVDFASRFEHYNCFSLTSADSIEILGESNKNSKISHLINRLTYMRGR